MFLHLLDDEQQLVFFQAATFLAKLDGLDPREAAVIEQARLECGVSKDSVNDDRDLSEILSTLDIVNHVAARNAVALELAGVVSADRAVSDDERAAFLQITSKLGLDGDRAERAHDLAAQWKSLMDETTGFLSEG